MYLTQCDTCDSSVYIRIHGCIPLYNCLERHHFPIIVQSHCTSNTLKGRTTMTKFFLSSLLSVAGIVSAFGGFTKSITFTTSGYQGSGPLANFPVLVKLSTAIEGFNYADFGATTNLVFKDSGDNVIPFEVDTWNTSGTSLIWVKVPSVTSTTAFKMYYCGSDVFVNNPASTWTDANYIGVWHMDEENGTVADATGHGLTATPTPAGGASVSIRYAGVDAPVGHARQTGDSATKCYLSVSSYNSFNVGDTFTISGWVRLTENVANNPRLFSRKETYNSDNGWEVEMVTASPTQFNVRGGARDKDTCKGAFNPTLKDNWTHVAFVYDGQMCYVYSNGYELVSGSITRATDNNLPLSIGCDSDGSEANIRGAFDECRLLDVVASADWIAAEYETVMNALFLSNSGVQSAIETVESPIFNPASDTVFYPSLNVTISCATAGATIYYTTDGTDPTDSSEPYAAPIAISSTTTIKARAYATGMAASDVVTATYTCRQSVPVPSGFKKSVEISLVNALSESPITTGIPALVRLSEDIPGFYYADFTLAKGGDMMFVDENGVALPHEVDTWNTAGESLVWVKLPSTAAGTRIVMCYGNGKTSTAASADVWSDYVGVWHLNETNETTSAVVTHSIGTYANSTATTGIDGHLSEYSSANETGLFGKCFMVNESTAQRGTHFKHGGVWVSDSGANSPIDGGENFTISGWFKHKNYNYYYDAYFYKRQIAGNTGNPTGAFAIQGNTNGAKCDLRVYGTGSSYEVKELPTDLKNTWGYMTFVFEGATCHVYENGVSVGDVAIDKCVDNNSPLVFGGASNAANGAENDVAWNGWIDEVRYAGGSKSAAWIAAEFAAMNTSGTDIFNYEAACDVKKAGVVIIIY